MEVNVSHLRGSCHNYFKIISSFYIGSANQLDTEKRNKNVKSRAR